VKSVVHAFHDQFAQFIDKQSKPLKLGMLQLSSIGLNSAEFGAAL